jgi:hypothetical protein
MLSEECHFSDQELLLAMDGELPVREEERIQSHLAACWACRTRQHEIEGAIGEFVQIHRQHFDLQIPAPDGRRALLKARLAQLAARERSSWLSLFPATSRRLTSAILAAACALVVLVYLVSKPRAAKQTEGRVWVTLPKASLTPGATVLASRQEICKQSGEKNKGVSLSLRRRVFYEYGIPAAEPSAYEVDYLITPALGGADDIHNLWPQSNGGTVWNAGVKDMLEDHLRDLVCDGQLDLGTAQREIAANWIEAYKKYFHTDGPLSALQ